MQRRSYITTAAAVAGLTVGAIFGPSIAGHANAQTGSPTASPTASASASASNKASAADSLRNSFLDKLAAALHIDRTTLNNGITSAGNSTADEAVQNGTLTQDQANALKQRIQQGDLGFFGGRGGHGGRGGFGGGVRGAGVEQAVVAATAKTLNLSQDQLITQLRSGQTLAQIAQAHGTTEQAVVNAGLAAAKTQLDTAVKNGTVTQAQADAAYAQLQQRGAALLNGGPGFGGHGFGGHHEPDADDNVPGTPSASPSASAGTNM